MVNLVIGSTSTTYDPIMASPVVRKISLTGSTAVGQQMIRDSAATMKRVSMELGGNAPVIVFEDVGLEAMLDVAVPVKFANAGQVCVTGDRFYVHESLHKKFVTGFASRARALKLGHGLDEATQMGPLINQRRDRCHRGNRRRCQGERRKNRSRRRRTERTEQGVLL